MNLFADDIRSQEEGRRGQNPNRNGQNYKSLFGLFNLYLSIQFLILKLIISNLQELAKREVVNVTHLAIPAELGGLLQAVAGNVIDIILIQKTISNHYFIKCNQM